MVSREEIYKIVATFLDSNFERDTVNKKFYLKKHLTDSELNDVICTFANLLGNKLVPMHDTNEIQHNFKLHSKYIEIDEKTIENAPKFGNAISSEFIKGITKKEDRFIIILDVDKIFSFEEVKLLDSMSNEIDDSLQEEE